MSEKFKVASKKCDQCLFSAKRIVSGYRARSLIKETLAADSFFVCHKGTIAGVPVCCKGFFDNYKLDSLATRIAVMFDAVEEVDVELLEAATEKEEECQE